MNEVGGEAAYYIDKKPTETAHWQQWKENGAKIVEKVLTLNTFQRTEAIEKSFSQSQKFTSEYSLNAIEAIYKEINIIV